MLYAKVVLGIPVEGPFDYIVPTGLCKKVKAGARVRVSFGNQRLLGYVVKLSAKTSIKKLKTLSEVIDDLPVLDKNLLLLTKELSDYYCCSWGEAIETALPESLRRGKCIPPIQQTESNGKKNNPETTLIQDSNVSARWDIYCRNIKEALDNNTSAIVLLSGIDSVLKAKEIINKSLGIQPVLMYRKQPNELGEWLKIRQGGAGLVLGTRSAIFAPVNNLGLVVMDEEHEAVYKQDQVPHYHAREVAFMRTKIEKAKLILGSTSLSLEMLYLARKNKIKYTLSPPQFFPEIKIIDTCREHYVLRKTNISKYLEDAIASALRSAGKVLLFLNRKGFATFASCGNCGWVLRCPRCNINLVYYFKDNILNCHYCNFKMGAPKICPHCNCGYIRYAGIGTEKIESELSRVFPQAKIKRLDDTPDPNLKDENILVATESIIKEQGFSFSLTGVLSIDNSLNRIDFRAGEKTFALLVSILGLTRERLIIQTGLPEHHCFQALLNKDINTFYNEELRQRDELGLPPFKHLGLVKLRGAKEDKVKEISNALFKCLVRYNKDKRIKVVSVNPARPAKLRGKFCWQILVKSGNAKKITKFLKISLKNFPHSGIIVTVDIDPI